MGHGYDLWMLRIISSGSILHLTVFISMPVDTALCAFVRLMFLFCFKPFRQVANQRLYLTKLSGFTASNKWMGVLKISNSIRKRMIERKQGKAWSCETWFVPVPVLMPWVLKSGCLKVGAKKVENGKQVLVSLACWLWPTYLTGKSFLNFAFRLLRSNEKYLVKLKCVELYNTLFSFTFF